MLNEEGKVETVWRVMKGCLRSRWCNSLVEILYAGNEEWWLYVEIR